MPRICGFGADGQPQPNMAPILHNVIFSLKAGTRCLLVGANGAGKTTLLKILGGKHLVPRDKVQVLKHSPFHDTFLETKGAVAYIGGAWVRDISFAGYNVPLQVSTVLSLGQIEAAGEDSSS